MTRTVTQRIPIHTASEKGNRPIAIGASWLTAAAQWYTVDIYQNHPFFCFKVWWSSRPSALAMLLTSSVSLLRKTLFELLARVSATSRAYWISLISINPGLFLIA